MSSVGLLPVGSDVGSSGPGEDGSCDGSGSEVAVVGVGFVGVGVAVTLAVGVGRGGLVAPAPPLGRVDGTGLVGGCCCFGVRAGELCAGTEALSLTAGSTTPPVAGSAARSHTETATVKDTRTAAVMASTATSARRRRGAGA
jgi:hypothetical protein